VFHPPISSENSKLGYALFERACAAGDLSGCLEKANIDRVGQVTSALEFSQRACRDGIARACVIEATIRWESEWHKAVPQRDAIALRQVRELSDRACSAGDPAGCGLFANVLLQGVGGDKDEARAARALGKACDGEVESACCQLATMYEHGTGVAGNAQRADELMRRGRKLDDAHRSSACWSEK